MRDRGGFVNGGDAVRDAILITGAAGFLGTQVTRLMLEQNEKPIIVLIRGRDIIEGKRRLERIWQEWPALIEGIDRRIEVLTGDLRLPQFGLNDASYLELAAKVRTIIHLAADIRLNASPEELRSSNVSSVRNLLELAFDIDKCNGLSRFSYVSTAYVAGGRKGSVPEDALTDRYGFSNNYERSKFEGESLVREAGRELPVTVFRPGMVVGDSKSGRVKTFNTLYFPLRLYLNGKLKFLPVDPEMKINMVPCDYVSEAIAKLTFEPKAAGETFHLTLPAEALPTVREMIQFTRAWAAERLHVQLPIPVFLPFSIRRLKWLGRFFSGKSAVRSLLSLTSYFEEDRSYQRENLDRLLGRYTENWRDFFPLLLTYATDHGFMHRLERTVHEQAYSRLSGKSRPVRFHDVISGKTIVRSADEIRREIERIASAMRTLGIQPGDRIAIIGFNHSRYFAIDTAIGLCGCVSVPLYYSSPVSELTEIIADCGAQLIFAGVPALAEKLSFADLEIPVISFCYETSRCTMPENFISWQDFLLRPGHSGSSLSETEEQSVLKSPAGFRDIATLRYTSGTTGRPKGAAFDQENLRWMAETLASLPPWKARTRDIVYLSFLPMNHVVEGILASYAIYYSPAPIDVYYLENFQELQKAMPKIRPTVFFSVPRFYEKVWEKAAQSLIGRIYLSRKEGRMKRILGMLLRKGISKRAGIDRCAQLIVGSAPVSTVLLENFRAIGIEIHNAYGLTEAPLITLNRHRNNRIGTVGEPLPETEIKIANDGEVLVKGPQVMRGYYMGEGMPGLQVDHHAVSGDGWLHTGDLGHVNDEKYLVLDGRKKEVIINAYGKNINPVKIELLLREYTGINHVMICGDNRPYSTALFWSSQMDDPSAAAVIEDGIRKANEQLSRPEQVKKWVALTGDLSIECGELTANLKMKRPFILAKYDKIIEDLYR